MGRTARDGAIMSNSFYIKSHNNILAKIQELEELRQDSHDERDKLILEFIIQKQNKC